MRALSPEQRDAYRHDGFLFPLPALSPAEVAAALDDLARYERWLGKSLPEAGTPWRGMTYVFLPWVARLACHPAILDAVEDLVGPDILVYFATFFVKEPRSPAFTAWHQDATYFGLTPYEHVTAWLALTDASAAAGCMEVASFAGRPRQLRHAELPDADNLNTRGQTIVDPFDDGRPVAMALEAGSFSLHHTLAPHRSRPNRTDARRIGLGISYVPAHVRHAGPLRQGALLARGADRHGHFDLLSPPAAELDPAALALHARLYRDYRENYALQIRQHASAGAGD